MSTRRPVGPPRGVLQSGPLPGPSHHARIAPAAELAHLIEHFWLVRWDVRGLAPRRGETLPHPSAHFVLEAERAELAGVHTRKFSRELAGRGSVFGVKLRPGALRPLVSQPASAFTDRMLPLTAVFGVDAALMQQGVFAHDGDDERMVQAAESFLRPRLPPPDAEVERVAALVLGIAAAPEITRVEQLVAREGVSLRALQRLLRDYVGVSPKWIINRYRLHEALEHLHAGGDIDWVQLALQLGYYDQAHFIRDFRNLVGVPPAEYVRRRAMLPSEQAQRRGA